MASESLSNKLVKAQLPATTAAQDAAQASTNANVIVAESILDVSGKNSVQYIVNNTGANTITAQIQGRIRNANGTASAWVASSLAAADVAAGASVAIGLTACPFSEVAVFIDAKVDGAQGAALVYGIAKQL